MTTPDKGTARKGKATKSLPTADEQVASEVALIYLADAIKELTRRNWKGAAAAASKAAHYLEEADEYRRLSR